MRMAAEGGLKVSAVNGVKVYSITGQRAVASWQKTARRKSRRKDEEFLRRVELIQDLKFSAAATRMKVTPDQECIIASGVYPPQVRVYELREMSLKFDRHFTSEIVDFQVLGDDFSKLAFLCTDRSICLHAKFGRYYSTRIPRMGRDLAYDKWSCDLLVAASSPEIYCLNLEQGRFLAPLSSRSPGVNAIGRSPAHGLIACGGEDGALECFDLRQRAAVARIDAVKPTGNVDQEVTALRFDDTEGLFLAAGTSAGQVLVYDIRSSAPIAIKDHMYDAPIVDIKWHGDLSSPRKLVTSDTKVIRIWEPETGKSITNIEPPNGHINDVCVFPNSGLIFVAVDNTQIPAYFIPALGPAPKWCSYLENLTEELEDGAQTVIYDDYKFVTKDDLERLNLTNLIGTNLLRAYMHGYFIDHRLYGKAKSIADPFAYEVYRQQRIKEKLDEKRASRITVKRKLPKVNQDLAARLIAAGDEVDDKKKKRLRSEILDDERFASLFSNKDFEIDETAEEYKARHPNETNKKNASLIQEHFELQESSGSEGDASGSEGEDKETHKSNSAPRLYKAKDEIHAKAFRDKVSLAAEHNMPMEERVTAAQSSNPVSGGRWGSRELSFSRQERKQERPQRESQSSSKRGIQSLGLKSEDRGRPSSRGRGRGGRGRGRGGRGRGRG
ncbi:nucleolar protein 10 [Selaginella moellendorffii]|uniref:nucleolar protein 10 n=1 Tax=Selaginella moellendorffii TaxID=88036 RepID=UPI000D1C4BC2|nr:nucleolar protein 10 [Selaginella moellendorffii]|eukprot:XP_024523152.1 nucleolar protein 10 [Selaginella moellendorffii]